MSRRLYWYAAPLIALPSVSAAAETATYTYDALGRLVRTQRSGGPADGDDAQTRYDPAGNRAATAAGIESPRVFVLPFNGFTVLPVGGPSGPSLPVETTSVTFSLSGPGTVAKGAKAVFQIAKNGPMAVMSTVTLNYATTDVSAISPADYAGAAVTLVFRPWELIKTLPIQTTDDGLSSPDKQFSMTISSPSSGGSISNASAGATIASSLGTKPVTNPDTDIVGICSGKTINVTANDTDPYGGYPLTLVGVTAATLGQATIVSASSIRFVAAGAVGGDQVTYTVRNTAGFTSTGTLQVDIRDLGGCQ